MNKRIDGYKIAEEIIIKVKKKALGLKMAVFMVGRNPASLSYISQKEKYAQKAGVDFKLFSFPENISKQRLIKEIKKNISSFSGLIVQLPLPNRKIEQEILNCLPEKKDIDLLSEKRLGKFYTGDFSILPPVVAAFNYIMIKEKINLQGKKIALIGTGRLVGKPLIIWLMKEKATILTVNQFTNKKNFKDFDIVISGVGKQGLIKGSMVKKGVIAIDVGSCFVKGKIKGDFDATVYRQAKFYTSVPGGIGPVTTACLIENLVKLNL